jgi:Cu2+-exporting ATPase
MTESEQLKNQTAKRCGHCRRRLEIRQQEYGFCCSGCAAAWQFIHDAGFAKFYELPRTSEESEPVKLQSESLIQLFDDAEFQKAFCQRQSDGSIIAQVSVGGLECYSCIWLIEQVLERQMPEVKVSASLSSGVARLNFDPAKTRLSEVIRLLRRLGFSVNPVSSDYSQVNSRDLIRLGVSSFCLMNVMLVSVPEYVDAGILQDEVFWSLFRWLSFGFGAVVMTYGAAPFYRSSWLAARQKRANIDQSIMLALVATFVFSMVNTFRGQGPIYFDSICAVVTLLGWGRYLQRRVMQNAEQSIRGVFDYAMQYLRKQNGDAEVIVAIADVKCGDRFFVLPGDPIPVDARLVKGSGSINYEQLTGESDALTVQPGDKIVAGAVNLSSRLELEAIQPGNESFILRAKSMIDRILDEKGTYSTISDRLGSGFFALIVVFALVILWWHWSVSPEEAISRTIAALLIACPCAFAIAVPLTMATCAAEAIKQGVILKSQRAIEVLGRVSQVFFDKTGTLTAGRPKIVSAEIDYQGLQACELSQPQFLEVLQRLSRYSSHHVVAALSEWAHSSTGHQPIQVDEIRAAQEVIGQGMVFQFRGLEWRLGRAKFCGFEAGTEAANALNLTIAGRHIASFELDDPILDDARSCTADLKKMKLALGIISGDLSFKTEALAKQLDIPSEMVFSEQSPEDKVAHISNSGRESRQVLRAMVGNGFNDSLALVRADIGIAVAGANQQAKDAADVCLMNPGIRSTVTAIRFARGARRKLYQSFAFGVVFNLIGLTLSARGWMPPVVAAILMPFSSLVVVLIAMKWPKSLVPRKQRAWKTPRTIALRELPQ